MITLKTLAKATRREVFEQVRDHLLNQKKRSTRDGLCAYRGNDGLMCAAGCLMSDEEYNPSMERQSWPILAEHGVVPRAHVGLIRELQDLHDVGSPELWEARLYELEQRL